MSWRGKTVFQRSSTAIDVIEEYDRPAQSLILSL